MHYITFSSASYYAPVLITTSICFVLARKIYQIGKSFLDQVDANAKKIVNLTHENKNLQAKVIELSKELYTSKREFLFVQSIHTKKYIYDKKLLQKAYFYENQNNIHRTIRLKVVHVTPGQIGSCLCDWQEMCIQKMKLYDPQNPTTKDIYDRVISTSSLINSIKDDISNHWIKQTDRICIAVDDSGKTQAICISSDDKKNQSARTINYLVSSPLNLRHGGNHYVEGAATALIQEVIEQALKKQNLNPESPVEIFEGQVAVTLYSLTNSMNFYKHIGFVDYCGGVTNMILKHNNLVEFLNKYGGRYYE